MTEHSAGEAPDERDSASGFTLIELMVAVSIFTIFIAVFLAAVVSLTRGTTEVRATSESTGGVMVVFQNIDRQVRYAEAINFPGRSSATQYRYIEFLTPASSDFEGKDRCTQWRYLPDLQRIESRQWEDVSGSVATPWTLKLSAVIDADGSPVTYPFSLIPAGTVAQQQLKLVLEAGSADGSAASSIESTFVARNSAGAVTSAVGADGQSATPVCQRTNVRP